MRRGNYSFVAGSHFQPFTMQEMLVPLTAYKDAYEKSEAAYDELTEKADTFKYLAKRLEDNPDSEAAKIYKGYADELQKQARDLAQNGLTMGNRRALANLKRRYQGEIGQLDAANRAMEEERKLRRQMSAKDSSMLYAVDNLDIDQFLGGNTPNLYNISGTELYSRGAAAGKSASSRVYSAGDEGSTLNGYYRKWVERNGYSKESMDAFRARASEIPELQQAALDILKERGADVNLKGDNYNRAYQSVLNGIIDGAMYQESVKPVRDAGVMSASERDASARGWAANNRAQEEWNMKKQEYEDMRKLKYKFDENGNVTGLNPEFFGSEANNYEVDPNTGKLKKKARTSTAQTPEEKAENSKQKELLKLDKSSLRSEKGFDVAAGNGRHHYDYIAALVHNPKQNKWYSGHFGEDFQGHDGLALWSDVNVVDRMGNYSVTRWGDEAERKVLAPNEVAALATNPDIADKIEDELIKSNLFTERTIEGVMSEYNLSREKAIKQLKESGYKYISDYQLVSVKNDEGDDDYLIAVRTK